MFKELLRYVLPKEIVESFDLVDLQEKEKIGLPSLCVYPQIFFTLNKKNFISVTPLSEALKALILALKDSAEAFVERLIKKFNI
jgi:hypothetical protein